TLAILHGGTLAGTTNIVIATGAIFDVSGTSDTTPSWVLGNNQILSGSGTVNGNLTIGSAATISPGSNAISVLAFSNALTLQGAAIMELKKTTATNDSLQVGGVLTFGGTLILTNLSGILTTNDSFKLFNAASYSGAFTNIIPPVPLPGLKWDTSL